MRIVRLLVCISILLLQITYAGKPISIRLSENDRTKIILSVISEMEKANKDRVTFLVIDDPLSQKVKAILAERFQLISRKDAIAKRQTKEGITFFVLGKLKTDRSKAIINTGYESGDTQGGSGYYGEYSFVKVKGVWNSKYKAGSSFCDAAIPIK